MNFPPLILQLLNAQMQVGHLAIHRLNLLDVRLNRLIEGPSQRIRRRLHPRRNPSSSSAMHHIRIARPGLPLRRVVAVRVRLHRHRAPVRQHVLRRLRAVLRVFSEGWGALRVVVRGRAAEVGHVVVLVFGFGGAVAG